MSNMHQNFCPCCGKPLQQHAGPFVPYYQYPGLPYTNPYYQYPGLPYTNPYYPTWGGTGDICGGAGVAVGGTVITQNSVN
jgi:hypothetical protein